VSAHVGKTPIFIVTLNNYRRGKEEWGGREGGREEGGRGGIQVCFYLSPLLVVELYNVGLKGVSGKLIFMMYPLVDYSRSSSKL